MMTNNHLGAINSTSTNEIKNWLANDFEWILKKYEKSKLPRIDKNASNGSKAPVFSDMERYNEIVTFAFKDNDGNKGVLDITDFESPKSFLQAIKEKLLQYQYCIAWGSKSIKRKNPKTGQLEGINGDLVVLDSNFKANRIPSIVRYNEYSNIPFLKKDIFTNTNQLLVSDIDLLKVFAKPLVRLTFINRYKSLRLPEVCKALLGIGKLENKTGAQLVEMSVEARKEYCMHDAHLVAELVRLKNGDIMRMMQIIAFHTGLTFEEVCYKGMTGIWKKIIDKSISKKIKIDGYVNLHSVLKKLYSNNSGYCENDDNFSEDLFEEENSEYEDDEISEYKENYYEHYIDLLDQKKRETDLNSGITFGNANNSNLHKNEKIKSR
jgi:hypothetical protein